MPELREVLPKYLQVANHYRDLILSGGMSPGDEVPSERQLAAEWGIARPTATKALEVLRNQGLVESLQGSGTYVRAQVQFHRRARDRYIRSRQAGRIYAPGEYAEIVAAERARAPDWVVESLSLPSRDAVRRRRVTRDEEGAVEVSTSWFSIHIADAAPKLLRKQRIREGTIAYLESVTGRRATYARDQIAARTATASERRELGIDARSAAVLVVHHVVHDAAGQSFECVEAIYPPDRWTFEQEYPI